MHIVITLLLATIQTLQFAESQMPLMFLRSPADEPYLANMRATYKLDGVIAGAHTDYDRVRAISKWVRSRWEHNGDNTPAKNDPVSILEEAATGKKFRCVEYAIVLAAALNAERIPARVVALATEDVETRESGAGHVVAEAWLSDAKKWIMVDGQFDVIPLLDGKPLNAVELQNAIATHARGLTVASLSGTKPDEYFAWVGPYLYYFRVNFDQRYPSPTSRAELCLLPVGAKPPGVFQKKWSFGAPAFTQSLAAFYSAP